MGVCLGFVGCRSSWQAMIAIKASVETTCPRVTRMVPSSIRATQNLGGGLEFEHDHLSAGDAKVSSNCRDRNSLRTDGVLENVRSGPARSVLSVAHVPHLAQFIHEALPQCLSFRRQSLVDALILTGGSLASADDVARLLGVADRFALYRLLRHDGLPSFRRLRSWINVLTWTWAWNHMGHSLERWAFVNGRSPASCYRMVRRLTGKSWRVVASLGTGWVIERFLKEVHQQERKAPRPPSRLLHLSILLC